MAKSPYLTVHRALMGAFQGVHFHVKAGGEKIGYQDLGPKPSELTVEYDPEEFLAKGYSGDILGLVNATINEFFEARGKDRYVRSIYLNERESPQSAEDRQLREFVEGFKNLVTSDADNSTLEDYSRENVYKLPWRGPTAAAT